METIKHDDWTLTRTEKDGYYIYEYWHKPHKIYCPMGRYTKYTMEKEEIVVIEDGPYLGQV